MDNKENLLSYENVVPSSKELQPSPKNSPSLVYVRKHPHSKAFNGGSPNTSSPTQFNTKIYSPMNNLVVSTPKPGRSQLAQFYKDGVCNSPYKDQTQLNSPIQTTNSINSNSPKQINYYSASTLSPKVRSRNNSPSKLSHSPSKLSYSPLNRVTNQSPALSPLAWHSRLQSPKFVLENDHPLANNRESKQDSKEEILSDENLSKKKMWDSIIEDWAEWSSVANKSKLRSLVTLRGIYPSHRKVVWKKLAKTDLLKEKYLAEGFTYQELKSRGPSSSGRQIDLDIPRTFQCHDYFKTEQAQIMLFNILNSYAYLNPQVGYCQGMSFLCGALMMVIIDEEDVFWTFVFMMQQLHTYFLPTMEGLIRDNKNLSALLNHYLPELASHFEDNNVETLFFSSRWLLSMFTDWPVWETVLRSWDIFFIQGRKGLLRICLAALKLCQGDLLQCNMEEMLLYIFKIPVDRLEPHIFGQMVHSIDIDEIINQVKLKNKEKNTFSTPVTSTSSNFANFYNAATTLVSTIMTPRPTQRTSARNVQIEDQAPSKVPKLNFNENGRESTVKNKKKRVERKNESLKNQRVNSGQNESEQNMEIDNQQQLQRQSSLTASDPMFKMFSTPQREKNISKKNIKSVEELTTFSTSMIIETETKPLLDNSESNNMSNDENIIKKLNF